MLDGERDDRRFEKFTADLFSIRDGIDYETTAATGDTGVDAEAQRTLAKGVAVVCATTQAAGHRAKAKADVEKQIARSRHLVRLHICFSKDLAKSVLDEIRADAAKRLPAAEVEVHGQSGLCDLAFRYQKAFLESYSRELAEHALWLKGKADDDDDDNQVNILRVAITTVFEPEMAKQRQAILDTLIVTALADGKPKTTAQLNASVAAGLKLARPPLPGYLLATLESLRGRAVITRSPNGFKLTDAGYELRDAMIAKGARSSMDGRTAFRSLLGDLDEESLSQAEFSKLWLALQRQFTHLFLNNGLRVIGELQAMLRSDEGDPGTGTSTGILSRAVQGALDDIAMLRLRPPAARRVAEVLGEMLGNRHSPAFRWISELGVKYIVVCALGLDPELEQRVRDRIANWVVIPDTHVVLSYICKGDEGHAACAAVLKQLHRFECEIWAMQPVLEEAVHHAEIAADSFEEWLERVRQKQREYPELRAAELLQASDNAFVKGFAAEIDTSVRRSEWTEYIGQFKGQGKFEIGPLARVLEAEIGAIRIDDDGNIRSVGRAYAQKLLNPDHRPVDSTATLRCEWDGRLLASCVVRRRLLASNRRAIIVSDSDRLRTSMYSMINPDKRAGIKVVEPAALAYSLAFTPGTSVNLECVRHFLFSGNVNLPEYLLAGSVLAEAFLKAPRFLRVSTLNDRIEDALVSPGGAAPHPRS